MAFRHEIPKDFPLLDNSNIIAWTRASKLHLTAYGKYGNAIDKGIKIEKLPYPTIDDMVLDEHGNDTSINKYFVKNSLTTPGTRVLDRSSAIRFGKACEEAREMNQKNNSEQNVIIMVTMNLLSKGLLKGITHYEEYLKFKNDSDSYEVYYVCIKWAEK